MARVYIAGLTITYEGSDGQSLAVATVRNEDLLWQAARIALKEAEESVKTAAREDPLMGELQAAEAQRLRTTLAVLIPGFENSVEGKVQ